MIPDEFQQLIEEQTDAQLLGPCLHDDLVPYVFEPEPAAWDTFRDLLAEVPRWGNRVDYYSLFVAIGNLLQDHSLSRSSEAKIRNRLIEIAGDINEQLEDPSADTSEPSKQHARAIEKGSNDKARRADRHETLCDIIKPFLKEKK